MAETTSDLVTDLRRIQNIYDQYFVSLASGDPVKPELPEITPKTLSDALKEAVPVEFDIDTDDINNALDALKAGFAYIKLNKQFPDWANGIKLTAIEDVADEDEHIEEEGDSGDGDYGISARNE